MVKNSPSHDRGGDRVFSNMTHGKWSGVITQRKEIAIMSAYNLVSVHAVRLNVQHFKPSHESLSKLNFIAGA